MAHVSKDRGTTGGAPASAAARARFMAKFAGLDDHDRAELRGDLLRLVLAPEVIDATRHVLLERLEFQVFSTRPVDAAAIVDDLSKLSIVDAATAVRAADADRARTLVALDELASTTTEPALSAGYRQRAQELRIADPRPDDVVWLRKMAGNAAVMSKAATTAASFADASGIADAVAAQLADVETRLDDHYGVAVKAAGATEMAAFDRAQRQVLGLGRRLRDVAERAGVTVDDPTVVLTKAAAAAPLDRWVALAQARRGLDVALTKLEEAPTNSGPSRMRPPDAQLAAAALDETLDKAAHFRQLAETVTSPSLAAGYLAKAVEAEQAATRHQPQPRRTIR